MPFLEILKGMVEALGDGASATIMGTDGLSLERYPAEERPSSDVEHIGVEYGGAISEIKKASEVLSLGELEEVVVSTRGGDVIVKMITPEYYLVLAVAEGSNTGKARYLAGRAARRAATELRP